MRRTVLCLLTPLLLIGGLLVTSVAAQAGPSPDKTEKKIIERHNKARSANQVKRTLRANKCLDRFAEAQARRQARQSTMSHQNLKPIMKRCKLRLVGENVASHYPNAGKVHRAWMRSPGHRANILGKKYNRIGVGMAMKDGVPYYAVVFGKR